MMPSVVMPKMRAPIADPIVEPKPPVSRQPPMTAAMMYRNSFPTPWPDWTVLNENRMCMPTNHAIRPTTMKRPIFVLSTGTPTARALLASPPTEKIQLPTRVLSDTTVLMAMKSSHQKTVMRTETGPIGTEDAKIVAADEKPVICEMSWEATAPVTPLVTARLSPWSIRKVPSVTRKLGMRVLTTRYPLVKPTPTATMSATTTPIQTFRLRL